MLGHWASFLVYLLFACLIAGSLLFASVALGTRGRRPGRQKSYSFESGVSVGRFDPSNFSINYYLTAMLFIVFDIEIVFLYPVAVLLDELRTFAFVELRACSWWCWRSATSTSGGRARSSGSDPARTGAPGAARHPARGHRHDHHGREGVRLGVVQLALAVRVRPRVLRHGDDRHDHAARDTTSRGSAPRWCGRPRARPI